MKKIAELIDRVWLKIVLAYLIYSTLYLLGSRVALTLTAEDMVSEYLRKITGVLDLYRIMYLGGALVAVLIIYKTRKYIMTFDILMLALFGVILLVAAVWMREYGLSENIIESTKIILAIFICFQLGKCLDISSREYLWKRVIFWSLFIWNIGSILALWMYMINYQGAFVFSSNHHFIRQGIMEGRLFGMFSDPNSAAMIALFLIIGIIWSYRKLPSRLLKIYYVASAVLYVIYITMSGSRSTIVSVIVVSVVAVYYRMRLSKNDPLSLGKTLLCELAAVAILVIAYFAIIFCVQTVGMWVEPDRATEEEFIREDANFEDISNSRFKIWGEYLTLWKDEPVVGFSAKGVLHYAEAKDPQAYLVEHQYTTHNSYLMVLIEGGVLGVIVMLVFLLGILKRWFMAFKERKSPDISGAETGFMLMSFCCVLGLLAFCVFMDNIFNGLRYENVVFWFCLGTMAGYGMKKEAIGG